MPPKEKDKGRGLQPASRSTGNLSTGGRRKKSKNQDVDEAGADDEARAAALDENEAMRADDAEEEEGGEGGAPATAAKDRHKENDKCREIERLQENQRRLEREVEQLRGKVLFIYCSKSIVPY